MKVDGQCLCGYLSYEAEVDDTKVQICHCSDCQVLSGSAFRVNVPVIGNTFRFVSGVPKTYVKIAASGNRRILAFCPECGSSVYSKPEENKSGYFGLRVGSLRQRDDLAPSVQVWRQSARSWIDDISDLVKVETQ